MTFEKKEQINQHMWSLRPRLNKSVGPDLVASVAAHTGYKNLRYRNSLEDRFRTLLTRFLEVYELR